MFPRKLGLQSASMSDAVYMEIVGTLYGTAVPILSVGLGQAIVGGITAWQTGDTLTSILAAVGVVVAGIRAHYLFAFRRRLAKSPPLDRSEATRWEWRYAFGSIITALIIGVLAGRSLTLGDAICSVMEIGIAFGFGAGVVSRLSLRPVVAIADLAAVGLPVIAVALWQQRDVAHVALAVFLTIYLTASFEMVRLMYNSILGQMTLKQEFERLARLDPMTGLLNRSVLASDLMQIIAGRGEHTVAVYAIDLDHFKAANDKFGHSVGDALLKQVAGRLRTLAKEGDLLVRMGGDEFVLVQKLISTLKDAEAMALRVLDVVCAPYCIDGHDIVIGASIGIALSPADGTSTEVLLSRSDKALYQAKIHRGGHAFAQDLPVVATAREAPAQQRAA